CQVGVKFGGIATSNVNVVLEISYEFDDSAQATRVKTVMIPIESITGNLTKVLAQIGTKQVPQLTGAGSPFCPENSPTLVDLFFWFYSYEGGDGTTNYSLAVSLDAEAEANFGAFNKAQGAQVDIQLIWQRLDMDTTTTHALKARGNNVTNMMTCIGAVLYFTYTYTVAGTTRIVNSLQIPVVTDRAQRKGGEAAGDAASCVQSIFLEEPGTLSLVQSGFLSYNYAESTPAGTQGVTLSVAIGAQAERAYTLVVGTSAGKGVGPHSFIQRFDAGGAQGAGITLARGENTLTVKARQTSVANTYPLRSFGGIAYLNYQSDVPTLGISAANHTISLLLQATTNFGPSSTGMAADIAAVAPTFPESLYWLTSI